MDVVLASSCSLAPTQPPPLGITQEEEEDGIRVLWTICRKVQKFSEIANFTTVT